MRVKSIDVDEIRLFYLWLSGKIEECKQSENLLLVYVTCPAERENLIFQFLSEFNNVSRFTTFKNYLLKGGEKNDTRRVLYK